MKCYQYVICRNTIIQSLYLRNHVKTNYYTINIFVAKKCQSTKAVNTKYLSTLMQLPFHSSKYDTHINFLRYACVIIVV